MLFSNPLFWIAVAACAAVLVVLTIGILGFAKGGEFNRRHGNRLMRYRVIAQGIAIALIILFAVMNSGWWR